MLRLLCTAEFDDGWTERFGKLVEIDRVGWIRTLISGWARNKS